MSSRGRYLHAPFWGSSARGHSQQARHHRQSEGHTFVGIKHRYMEHTRGRLGKASSFQLYKQVLLYRPPLPGLPCLRALSLPSPLLATTAPPKGLRRNCVSPCDNAGSNSSACPAGASKRCCWNASSDVHQHLSLLLLLSGGLQNTLQCSRRDMGCESQLSPPCQLLR